MCNIPDLSNTARRGIEALRERLPPGWEIDIVAGPTPQIDALLLIRAPDGSQGRVVIESKSRITASTVAQIAPRLKDLAATERAERALLIAPFLTPISRKRLAAAGVSFLDLSGNVLVQLDRPALWIFAEGAARDPAPIGRGVRSLKGAKAGRLVRALCDWKGMVGVRELANRTGVSPAYTSRVLALLEDEDVVARSGRGEVVDVRWRELLTLWARDYEIGASNQPISCLAPQGLKAFTDRLRSAQLRYAVTASLAVPPEASIAPARRASCFVADVARAIQELSLVETETGSNVLLLQPFDPVVYERCRMFEDLTLVALSQCVVDLLTGTGREPSQGEALLDWMESNEDAWRLA